METLAPMNARSLLMVMRSRTLGILCTVTWSAVSRAAAITGSAEFFAPLTLTVPCRGLPPLIRNLSIASERQKRIAQRRRGRRVAQRCDACGIYLSNASCKFPFCCGQFFLRTLGVHSMLQHYQCDSHVVSRLTQGVFG